MIKNEGWFPDIIQQFRPTVQDYIVPPPNGPRRSLGEIFAGGALDEKLKRIEHLENQRMEDESSTGTGTFYQNLLKQNGGVTIPLTNGPEGEQNGG